MKESISEKIMEATKEIIAEETFRKEHTNNPEKDFTRNRKLSFTSTMMFVLGNSRTSLELAADKFGKEAQLESISAAAICKARAKISYTAFRDVFEACAAKMPTTELYQGYQLIAIDGMKGNLPNTTATKAEFPVIDGNKYPIFHAVAAYDVLNCYFMAAQFLPAPANEREEAFNLLDKPILHGGKKIFLFDRGFPSISLIQKLNKMEHSYIMRVSSSFLREVNTFTKSNAVDRLLHISYDKRRGAMSGVKAELPYEFDIRCVRIRFIDGTEEICITNLPRKEFPKRKIKEMYGLRWEIETSFNHLKNAVYVEEFSSYSGNGIKQDFYTSLWATNFITAVLRDESDSVFKKEDKEKEIIS